jgi:hypothetical protein
MSDSLSTVQVICSKSIKWKLDHTGLVLVVYFKNLHDSTIYDDLGSYSHCSPSNRKKERKASRAFSLDRTETNRQTWENDRMIR